jgi:Ni,Fe-hydrogenase III small subunit
VFAWSAGATGPAAAAIARQALLGPVYDIHRLGVFITASPRHADVLLVTGAGTPGMTGPLRTTYDGMPDPAVVAAAKRLQSGRLDAHLLYMLIALVAVIALVTAFT